jgi:hypothetical protein
MKVTTTTKYGGSAQENRDGFKIAATAEISDAQVPVLCGIGLASVLYRGGASVLNEALGVTSNSKSEFSDEDAANIREALKSWAQGEDSPLKGGFNLQTVVTRYVHGEGSTPKFVEEKQIIARHVKAGDFAQWMHDKVGFDATVTDAEKPEVLQAVKAYKQRLIKES